MNGPTSLSPTAAPPNDRTTMATTRFADSGVCNKSRDGAIATAVYDFSKDEDDRSSTSRSDNDDISAFVRPTQRHDSDPVVAVVDQTNANVLGLANASNGMDDPAPESSTHERNDGGTAVKTLMGVRKSSTNNAHTLLDPCIRVDASTAKHPTGKERHDEAAASSARAPTFDSRFVEKRDITFAQSNYSHSPVSNRGNRRAHEYQSGLVVYDEEPETDSVLEVCSEESEFNSDSNRSFLWILQILFNAFLLGGFLFGLATCRGLSMTALTIKSVRLKAPMESSIPTTRNTGTGRHTVKRQLANNSASDGLGLLDLESHPCSPSIEEFTTFIYLDVVLSQSKPLSQAQTTVLKASLEASFMETYNRYAKKSSLYTYLSLSLLFRIFSNSI